MFCDIDIKIIFGTQITTEINRLSNRNSERDRTRLSKIKQDRAWEHKHEADATMEAVDIEWAPTCNFGMTLLHSIKF